MRSLVLVSSALAADALAADDGAMRQVFDDLTQFAVRIPFVKYPDAGFTKITDCLKTCGDTLYPSASDAAWTGWTQFGINRGQPGDPWSLNNTAQWMEYDPRNLTYKGHDIPIIEPCNTVSNLAYYRIIPDLCANRQSLAMSDEYVNAIAQGFATLGMGSSFMHGSRTSLGGAFDNIPISVIAYQYFQLMTDALKPGATGTDSILHELSATPRAYDGRELATKIHTIPLEHELNDWHKALDALDRPQYFFTFGAIIVNALTLVAPDVINDQLIPLLISLFGLSDDVKDFLINQFVPTVRGAMKDVKLSLAEKAQMLPKFAGTVLKLLWAFTWQEGVFPYKQVYNPTWNLFGAVLIPAVNSLANRMTGFSHPDDSIQKGESIYPGQDVCNVKHTSPHAKWHEISANGLMDLGYLADYVKIVIDKALPSGPPNESSDIFMKTEVVDLWADDMKQLQFGDGYLITQAFVQVVKGIVTDMDKCGGDAGDGTVTWQELACYLTSRGSAAEFVNSLFESIDALYNPSLARVHATPLAKPAEFVLV